MKIMFDRPLFGTTKYLKIEQGGNEIGKMRRWLRSSRNRASSNPRYDINIEVVSPEQTYKITQQSFSLREGFQWEITRGDHLFADMTSAKGLKEKHRVDLQKEQRPTLSIEATWGRKGLFVVNDQQVGETKAVGFLVNSQYITEIEDMYAPTDPVLLAGVTYAFWSSFQRG